MKPSGMNGMRSGYSSSNGTAVSTLASESGDFSMRSNTPSILPNSNQKQNGNYFSFDYSSFFYLLNRFFVCL